MVQNKKSIILTKLLIKDREWKYSCTTTDPQTLTSLFDHVHEVYGLEDYISSNFCLSYYTHSKNRKHTKSIRGIKENETNEYVLQGRTCIDERGNERQLTLEQDLTLHVVIDAGSDCEKDITCNSQFMMYLFEGSIHIALQLG